MMKIFSVPMVRLALLLCTALYSGSAQAQWNKALVGGKFNNEPGFYTEEISTIPVRAAGHDTYSRLVVDWPGKVFYEVEDDNKKGRVLIKFKRRAQIDMTEVRTAPSTNFGSVEVLSGLNEPLVLAISIPPGAKHKVYSIGYKVILDVDDVPGQKRGDFKRDVVDKKAPKAPTPMTAPSVNPESAIAPETKVADIPDKIITPATINWTSTKNFDIAAFARHNIIYIVTSNTDMTFAPRFTDGDKKLNPTRIPTEDGEVYRIILPAGAVPRLMTAGANLSWDLTINSPSKPSPARAVFKMSGEKNDIAIDLPVSGRIVKFKDPDTGENYTVLPAASAQNYSDKSLKTPDLEILPSAAGLVLRTFNDKIDITLNDSNVLLSLPQGFAYEPSIFAVKPDKPVTDTVPAPLPENALTDSKRLLTFNRWTATLPRKYAEARQILEKKLLEAAPDKKAENLINLARFELAQGYGPEALGYLNLALEMAPSLNRNPEYHALRGVSLALMGDSENALPDLNDPLLQTFEEIAMWRALPSLLTMTGRKRSRLYRRICLLFPITRGVYNRHYHWPLPKFCCATINLPKQSNCSIRWLVMSKCRVSMKKPLLAIYAARHCVSRTSRSKLLRHGIKWRNPKTGCIACVPNWR